MHNFSISSLNAFSLVSAARRILMERLILDSNSLIWLLQETKFNAMINFAVWNFNVFRADRLCDGGGGVAIVIHDSISVSNFKIFDDIIEAVSIEALLNGVWVQVVSCYIPPGISLTADCSERFASFLGGRLCFVGGDFNAKSTVFNDSFGNAAGSWLLDFCNNCHLSIVNPDQPTCFRSLGGSFIDKFLVRNVDIGLRCRTFASFSDHHGIRTSELFFSGSNAGSNVIKRKIFSWAKITKLNNFVDAELDKLDLPRFINLSTNRLDFVVDRLHDIFVKAIDLFVPTAQISGSKVTLSSNSLSIKKKNRYLCRKVRRVRFLAFDIVNSVKAELKLTKIMLLNSIKSDISNYYANILINLSDIHSFYHTVGVRKKASKFTKLSDVRDTDGGLVRGEGNVANLFADHFAHNHLITFNDFSHMSEIVQERVSNFQHCVFVNFNHNRSALPGDDDTYSSELVTLSEVKQVIASRNNKLSAGADGLPNRIIKLFDDRIISKLTILFNQLLAIGHFPRCWKLAHVIPIPKAGKDSSLVSNWRPISLLPCVAKIFERLVAVRIRRFLATGNIIPNNQFGFMNAHSTCHPLAILQNVITENLDAGHATSTVLLDVQAAFDTVWHQGLIFKLMEIRFPGYLISIIKNFLAARSFKVKVGNAFSGVMDAPAGVPQGSVLGPLLFIIYGYDMPKFNNCLLLQFADDTSLSFSYGRVNGVERIINTCIKSVRSWYKAWKFKLNTDKTDLIHFVGNCKQVKPYMRRAIAGLNIMFGGVRLQPKKEVKYLGLVFARNNKFIKHVDKAISKFNSAKNSLNGLLYSQLINCKLKKFLYTLYLRPILTYAAQVWALPTLLSSHQMERLRIVERRLIRCTHNIFRARHSYKFLANQRLYDITNFDRIDVFIISLSIRFHIRNLSSTNLLIKNITKENVNCDDNCTSIRTDYIYNLFICDKLVNANGLVTLFNRGAYRPHSSVYSEAQ